MDHDGSRVREFESEQLGDLAKHLKPGEKKLMSVPLPKPHLGPSSVRSLSEPRSTWLCVGRIEDLPAVGSWLKVPLTPAGVVVVRGEDGALHAFHGVCPHRGSSMPLGSHGCSRALKCPYHGMTFALDGRSNQSEIGDLSAARVIEAHGFVFVTIDADEPFELGEMPPWLQRLPRLRRVRRFAYDVAANWQLVLENFQETLHFPHVHPELEAITPSARADTWTPPRGGPWMGGMMPIVDGAETVSMSRTRMGRPVISDSRVAYDAMRFPNLMTSLQPDYLLTFVIFPKGDNDTHVIACTYFAEDAPNEKDAEEDVTAFWSRVYDQDKEAVERQQVGLASPGAKPMTYTDVEEGAEAVARMVRGPKSAFCGIFGRPYLDLSEVIDISGFAEIDREITRGLAQVEVSYTGGSLKWMGVCAPWVESEPHYPDYMHVISKMSPTDFADFLSLGKDDLDPKDQAKLAFGDETDHPLTKEQMLFLKYRFGVYFPWKVCYHLLENDKWEDKHSGAGKTFVDEARRVFPKTVAFVESLPFSEIGRVVLFGVEANDHAPLHRDSEPGKSLSIAQSISFCPGHARAPKRFYLATPDGSDELTVEAPIYWFNDMDWHGVHDDPWFRYSIRVDGVFDTKFQARLRTARHTVSA
jgi:glycine betaine catabolism A